METLNWSCGKIKCQMTLIRGNYEDGNGNKTGLRGKLLKHFLFSVCIVLLWVTSCWCDQKGLHIERFDCGKVRSERKIEDRNEGMK